jgi:hypothetical protein
MHIASLYQWSMSRVEQGSYQAGQSWRRFRLVSLLKSILRLGLVQRKILFRQHDLSFDFKVPADRRDPRPRLPASK